MQHISFEYARKADKDLAKKLRNKQDTRAAAVVEKVKSRSMYIVCGPMTHYFLFHLIFISDHIHIVGEYYYFCPS